jgi:glycosyltransferase involved in cell wall biosynthesis
LFAVGDSAALAQATLRAAADPELRAAIGARARAAVAKRPWAAALAEYEALFTAVLRERGGTRRG